MRTSHQLLLRYWYDPGYDFSQVAVEYISRGAPDDRMVTAGSDITSLSAEYFEIYRPEGTVCIPYHRIRKIYYQGKISWRR